MSNDLLKEEENSKKVVIGKEDVQNVRDFFKHFNEPWGDALEKTASAFEADMNFQNQEAFKVAICRHIVKSNNPLFKDKMFEGLFDVSEEIDYEEQFDKDLKEVLTQQD